MADIVLSTINAKWIHPSLALRLLKANLGEYENRCEIVEFALRQSLEEKLTALAGFRPKILGLSVSIWNHKASLELLKELRKTGGNDPCPDPSAAEPGNSKRPIVVLGGPEVSYIPEKSEIIRYADFVIRGEGEKAFAELCKYILSGEKLSDIPSLRTKRVSDSHVLDPANIYSAYRLYSDEDLRRKLIYVEASRDCPFSCAFCQSAIKASGSAYPAVGAETPRRKTVREFPLNGFLSDMEYLLTRLVSVRSNAAPGSSRPTIKFLDRSFNANIPRALSIMEFFLEKASRVPTGFQLHFEIVPSLFSPDLAKMISRFPPETLRLELGIQSFNPEACAAISRPSHPEKELETLGILRTQTNAIVHADLIAGLPGEDLVSFGEGFDRLWRALTAPSVTRAAAGFGAAVTSASPPKGPVAPFEIQLGILKGLPGTPLRELDEKFGMIYSSEPPYEVIETAALGKADLDRLRNFARFWELIVNRPWKAADNRAAGGRVPGSRCFRNPSAEKPEKNAAGLSAENPAAVLLIPGRPVFWPFMELSEKLFRLFGRNWGIDREALGAAVILVLDSSARTGQGSCV
jgi:radical SAM superfamily enzyme YgiQ (UPF0313 family)